MRVECIHTEYLTPSRTIETIEVGVKDRLKTVYVYNYEGYSFRLFTTEDSLKDFFSIGKEPDIHFSEEEELDDFLVSYS